VIRNLFPALALVLALASPALAQTAPNRLDIVERVTNADPARFACAHTNRECKADWIEAVACELHKVDPRFGLNGKRGNPADISLDVVTYRVGGLDDYPRVEAFDICVRCGAPDASAGWSNITNYKTIGRPGTAVYVEPVDCDVPPMTPPAPVPPPGAPQAPPAPPAPAVDLTPVLERLETILSEVRAMQNRVTEFEGVLGGVSHEATQAAIRASELKTMVEQLKPPVYEFRLFGTRITAEPRQ
jgi:hypothetical protein